MARKFVTTTKRIPLRRKNSYRYMKTPYGEDLCLKDYWEYFKNLNSQNKMLGVECFKNALEQFIKELKKRATVQKMLDFDKKPISDEDSVSGKKEFVYCGGCNRFVIEEGCTCGMIHIEEIDKLSGFTLQKDEVVKNNERKYM